jgi:hypothetical protein
MRRHQPAIEILESVAAELAPLNRAKHFGLWYQDTVPRLTAALTQEQPFSDVRSVWIYTGDGGGFATTPRFGEWAIDLLLENKTPEAVIAAFLAEVERNATNYIDVSPLFCVQVDSYEELGEGIALVPEPEGLIPAHLHRVPFRPVEVRAGTSFLYQSFRVTPAFERCRGEESARARASVTAPEAIQRDEVRKRLRLACLLVSAGPVELSLTVPRPENGALFVAGKGQLSAWPFNPRSVAALPIDCFPVKSVAVKHVFELLGKFRHVGSLARAIDRLGRARLAASPVDRALELGIAAEIGLMHDQQTDNSEITHKIGSRAAWLLGRNPSDREGVFREIKALYRARSHAVHRGELSSQSAVDLATSDRLVTRALIAILERGGFPDWNSLIMGGNGWKAEVGRSIEAAD